jgi:hypothetical protein
MVRMNRRLIIDSDGTNIFVAYSPLDREVIESYVAALPSSVTTFLICPNWIGKFMYPARVGEWASTEPLHSLMTQGEDPFGMLIQSVRGTGREVLVTYRANDVHGADDPDYPGTAEFKKAHPAYVVDPDDRSGGWMPHCLDYSRPQVQAYVLSSISDLAERYDVDGFQIDWMRFPRHLSGKTPEEVWARRGALTEFMASVRQMLDRVGLQRGKRMMLSARVPTWLQGCRHVGIDLAEWNRRGLLDFLTVAPFLSTDFRIPIGEFQELLAERPIPVYAGVDFGHSGRPHNPESLRAWALSMYGLGADGLNIFNFPCWTEYLGAVPYHWLEGLEDPERLRGKPALYSLITAQHRVQDVDQPAPLPAELRPGADTHFQLYLPPTALPARQAMVLLCAGGDVCLSINGSPVRERRSPRASEIFTSHKTRTEFEQEPAPDRCRLFEFATTVLRAGENDVALTSAAREALTLSRFDLGLWY